MRRDRQPGLKQLERQLLPDELVGVVPKPVREAHDAAKAAIEESRRAVGEAHQARQEAERAPEDDAAAELAAFRDGKTTLPKPKAPALKEKADQAERRARLSQQMAAEAVQALHASRRAHHDELVAVLDERLATARESARAAADTAEEQFMALARAALFLGRVHARAEELDRRGLPSGGRDLPHLFASLRGVGEDMARRALPMRNRVLEAVGDGATWDEVCAKLGVKPLDDEAHAVRTFLVREGRLEWLDAEGVPLRGRDPRNPGVGHKLVPSTPPERPVDRIKRERREREAAERRAA